MNDKQGNLSKIICPEYPTLISSGEYCEFGTSKDPVCSTCEYLDEKSRKRPDSASFQRQFEKRSNRPRGHSGRSRKRELSPKDEWDTQRRIKRIAKKSGISYVRKNDWIPRQKHF